LLGRWRERGLKKKVRERGTEVGNQTTRFRRFGKRSKLVPRTEAICRIKKQTEQSVWPSPLGERRLKKRVMGSENKNGMNNQKLSQEVSREA
jgi:hypothetical protein